MDEASDDVLATFAETLTAGRSALIGTFRPEYRGRLRGMAQSIGDVLCVGHSAAVLVRLMAFRQAAGDLALADEVVSRLEAELAGGSEPALQLWPLQCRAVLADAKGDEQGYLEAVTRYRDLAELLDARGHIADARRLARR